MDLEANFSDYDYPLDCDVFFLHLNEIDPMYLDTDNIRSNEANEYPKDPRSKKEVDEIVRYCGNNKEPYLYSKFPRKSTLSAAEHKICLDAIRILRLEPNNDIHDKILCEYRKLQGKLMEEHSEFDKFVKNYFMIHELNRKQNLDCAIELEMVKQWRNEIAAIPDNYNYHLQTALPTAFSEHGDDIVMNNLNCINKNSFCEEEIAPKYIRELLQTISKTKFIETFNSVANDNKEFFKKEIANDIANVQFIITKEILSKFLVVFHNSKQEWNISIDVDVDENTNARLLKFHLLPYRQISSLDRIEKSISNCVKGAFLQHQIAKIKKSQQQDLNDNDDTFKGEYKVRTFVEYMQDYHLHFPDDQQKVKLQWFRLNVLQMNHHEKLVLAFVEELLDNVSVKVEYQPEFGACEMLRHELINEWLVLQFSNRKHISRFRIDYEMQKLLQMRKLTLSDIDQELRRLYDINSNNLLNKIYQTLEQIQRFPSGKYLLNYTSGKPHIISVFKLVDPNQVYHSSSLNIQDYYSKTEFEKPFLEEVEWTPIDSLECTCIHYKAKVAPRLFPFHGKNISMPVEKKRMREPEIEIKKSKKKKNKKKRVNKLNKKDKLLQKLPKSDPTEECFAPCDLFDGSGQVKISNFNKNKTKCDVLVQPDDLEPVNLQQYEADASCTSDIVITL